LKPPQAGSSENQQIKLTGIIQNRSNVDLDSVKAGFYYNSGTQNKINLVLIEKKLLALKKGEEKTVSCVWRAKKSAEYWTDAYFIADPDNAIKEEVENAAFHEARASVIVKK